MEESVQEISPTDFVKAEPPQTEAKPKKTLLGKRTRKERAKKFLELEAEESETETAKELTEQALKNGKPTFRV